MTIERRISRARRNSVVHRIAHNIPQLENRITLDSLDGSELKRSHSSGPLIKQQVEVSRLLYPFSESEKHQISQQYLDSFDFNVLTSREDQRLLEYDQNLKYTRFLEACAYRQHNYAELIDRSSQIIDTLSDLTVKYDTVIKETHEFQSKSDSLLEEYTSYVTLNDDLKGELHYYELLDSFTRKLNNPSPNIVRRDSFKRMLAQLDECLQFVNAHPEHREHDVFSRRFKQCLIRSLTLIRNYVINNLKTIKDDLISKLSTSKTTVTQNALIYTRFGSDVSFLKDVTGELCERAHEDDEFYGLLNDCYSSYFSIRSKFLGPLLSSHLQSNYNDKKPLVQHAQSNISFFTKVLKDEFELFYQIFPRDCGDVLINWFQQLGESLHDDLRNSILREPSLVALCEMITLLEKYYEYEESEYHEDLEGDIPQFDNLRLGKVFEPVLQDVQSRLVFRAQMFVEENIVNYRPSSKDLQIGGRKQSTHEVTGADEEFVVTGASKIGLNEWYTPLSKGVSLLSKIYELVSSSVFDDLAHNIVHDCIVSLNGAYQLATSSIGRLDADLFLLKNLLMLKEQVQNFDIEYVSSETFLDFSGIGDIINKIRTGQSVFREGSGILGLVQEGVPKVVRNMIDARQELQLNLRNVVHIFTQDVVTQIVEPITKETVETALVDSRELRDNIEVTLPRVKSRVEMFIEDKHVVTALIDGIQELTVQFYEQYYNKLGAQVPDLVEVDTLVAFIGQVVSKMFEEDVVTRDDIPDLSPLAIEE